MNTSKTNVKYIIVAVLVVLGLTMLLSPTTVHAVQDWKGEYFTYGAGLSEAQLKETEELLGVPDDIEKILVDSEGYNKYTGLTTQDSSLYSSAVIIKTKKGSGVNVYINTPDNITQIEDHQYLNAALTSGLTDANIIIGSPVRVTGESALAGVYIALDEAGVEVNEEAAMLANEELSVVNEISQDNAENDSFDSEELTLALAEIKEQIAEIADRDTLTAEEVRQIVDEVVTERNLELTEAHKEMIAEWAMKFKSLDIDWNAIGEGLKNIGSQVADKVGELYEWGNESGFFADLWNSIKTFFTNLFS